MFSVGGIKQIIHDDNHMCYIAYKQKRILYYIPTDSNHENKI